VSRQPQWPRTSVADPLKREEVRKFLWDAKVLREPKRLPEVAEVALTQRLNSVQHSFATDEILSSANNAKSEARTALRKVQRAVDKFAEIEGQSLALAEATAAANPKHVVYEVTAAVLRDRLAKIAEIGVAMKEVEARPVLAPEHQKWGDHALFIFDALSEALSSVRKSIGVSDNGPAACFIEKVVPLLTGERTTRGGAAKMLRRRRPRADRGQLPPV
jgi:hypothetical protein